MAKAGAEGLRRMALAVAEGHQTRAVAEEEEEQHRMKIMVEAAAERGLPKKLEPSVLVLVSWAVEVAVGWQMDGVD